MPKKEQVIQISNYMVLTNKGRILWMDKDLKMSNDGKMHPQWLDITQDVLNKIVNQQ